MLQIVMIYIPAQDTIPTPLGISGFGKYINYVIRSSHLKLYDESILNSSACAPDVKEWMRCDVVMKTYQKGQSMKKTAGK